ncbi:A24 family peptidase [Tissierella sp. Yu-01]|uniref:prepilin peptidase n=1 Tax=Tissierella sp. Yu-01 TaxID=3035694 RepID=UPI00240D8E18|nr:A24 family peptidase [Tissierella sp. Yu-01]WFA09676.1 prepilin peptidase [Tissierella sp. Yu-01]
MTIVILIYGLIIGSFLNVCVYRIPLNESIAFPGSHCPNCDTHLKWYDNIPVISYLTIMGKCRYCREKVSLQYPIVEALNAILYLIMFSKFGFDLDFAFYSLLSSVLIVITFIDLKEMIIPDVLVVVIIILSLLYKIINYLHNGVSPQLLNSIGGLLLAGGLFLIIVFLSKGGMGGGDVTLIAALGFVLGIKYIFLNIFLSFVTGAIISIFLLATKIKTRKDPIPFGPFIVISFFLTVLKGQVIINWYFTLLI